MQSHSRHIHMPSHSYAPFKERGFCSLMVSSWPSFVVQNLGDVLILTREADLLPAFPGHRGTFPEWRAWASGEGVVWTQGRHEAVGRESGTFCADKGSCTGELQKKWLLAINMREKMREGSSHVGRYWLRLHLCGAGVAVLAGWILEEFHWAPWAFLRFECIFEITFL